MVNCHPNHLTEQKVCVILKRKQKILFQHIAVLRIIPKFHGLKQWYLTIYEYEYEVDMNWVYIDKYK